MVTQLTAFDVCRNFIEDNSNVMTNEERNLLLGQVRNRDFLSIIRTSADLEGHSTTLGRRRAFRQIGAFFKKNVAFRHEGTTSAAAYSAFERGERLCRITNKRLDHFYVHRDRLDPDMDYMIRRSESFIRRVLGDFTTFQEDIPFLLKVTAGATATASRAHSLPFFRFRRTMECAPRAVPYLNSAYRFFGYAEPKIRCLPWNRLAVVPKNCRTDRMIACEPVGNIPFQLAFDSYAKRRLKTFGIDLTDQSRNRVLARRGSIDGSYGTVDLSMASDTMSINAVHWLLPQPWVQYLSDLRSTHYSMAEGVTPSLDDNAFDLRSGKYAKFSSMGNGATFALETLIFASFAYAAGDTKPCVYGDDIVIPSECTDRLYRLLRFFGFIPNVEKSYTDATPFRESCGGDYFNGIDITPFYIRSEADWDLPNLCHNINGLAAVSEHGRLWEYLRSVVTDRALPFVPWNENSTSGVFITPHHAYQRGLLRRKNSILRTLMYVNKGNVVTCRDTRALALWFLRKQVIESDDGVVIASRHTTSSTRFRRKWVNWHLPVMGNPKYLYGLSDYLLRVS